MSKFHLVIANNSNQRIFWEWHSERLLHRSLVTSDININIYMYVYDSMSFVVAVAAAANNWQKIGAQQQVYYCRVQRNDSHAE